MFRKNIQISIAQWAKTGYQTGTIFWQAILVYMWITSYTSCPTLVIINHTIEIFTEIDWKIFLTVFLQNALISSVLKLEKCYLHENGVAFHQKSNGIKIKALTMALLAILRHFLRKKAFSLIHPYAGPQCSGW